MRCWMGGPFLPTKNRVSAAISSGGQIRRLPESEKANAIRRPDLVEVHRAFIPETAGSRCARAEENRETSEDQAGARDVTGRADNFCRMPTVRLHNPDGVKGVLNRVVRLRFF